MGIIIDKISSLTNMMKNDSDEKELQNEVRIEREINCQNQSFENQFCEKYQIKCPVAQYSSEKLEALQKEAKEEFEKTKSEEQRRKLQERELFEKLRKEKEEVLGLPMYTDVKWDSTKEYDKDDVSKMIATLQNSFLFQDFSTKQLKKFIPYFYKRHFSTGEYLFKKGNPGSCMFVICSGKVDIQETIAEDQPPVVYAKFRDGGMFGEMSLTGSKTRSTDAICVAETDVYVLFRYDLEDFFKREQALGWKFYTKINAETSVRLNNTNMELINKKKENEKMRAYIESIYNQYKKSDSVDDIKLESLHDVLTKWYDNTNKRG